MDLEAALLLAFIAAQGVFVVRMLPVFGWLPVPSLFGVYAVVAQAVLVLVAKDLADYSFVWVFSSGGFTRHLTSTVTLYACVAGFIYWLAYLLRLWPPGGNLEHATAQGGRFPPSFGCGGPADAVGWVASGFGLLFSIVLLPRLDWSIAWSHDTYLAMTDPHVMLAARQDAPDTGIAGWFAAAVASVAEVLLSALVPVGVIASAVSGWLLSCPSRHGRGDLSSRFKGVVSREAGAVSLKKALSIGRGVIPASLAVFVFLFLLGAHSRAAALIPAVCAAVLLVGRPPAPIGRRVISLGLCLAVVALAGALAGRNGAHHGFASIANLPGLLAAHGAGALWELLSNACEGAFAVAEAFGIVAVHSARYGLLSFSPLPSLIDGFSAFLSTDQIRLHEVVPMPGYSELWQFGVFACAAYAGLLALSMYLIWRMQGHHEFAFLLGNCLLFLSLYLMAAYPLRTALKPLWVADILALACLCFRAPWLQAIAGKFYVFGMPMKVWRSRKSRHHGLPIVASGGRGDQRDDGMAFPALERAVALPCAAGANALPGNRFGFVGRQWRRVAFAALGGLSLGIGVLLLVPARYAANVDLLLEPRREKVFGDDTVLPEMSLDNSSVDSQLAILRSRRLLRAVVDAQNLARDPAFVSAGGPGWLAAVSPFSQAEATEELGAASAAPSEEAVAEAIRRLGQMLDVERLQRSHVLRLTVRARDGLAAARLADAVAEVYQRQLRETRYANGRQAARWLESRVAAAAERLRHMEATVAAFRRDNGLLAVDPESRASLGQQQMEELSARLALARAETLRLRARQQQAQELEAAGDVLAVPDVMRSPTISALRAQQADVARREAELARRYGPDYPALMAVRAEHHEMRRAITAEAKRILTHLRAELNEADAREQALRRLVEGEAGAAGEALLRLRELERAKAVERAAHEQLAARARTMREQASLEEDEVRIISPAAVPETAMFPHSGHMVPLALALGLMSGLAWARARDTAAARQLDSSAGRALRKTKVAHAIAVDRSFTGIAADRSRAHEIGTAINRRDEEASSGSSRAEQQSTLKAPFIHHRQHAETIFGLPVVGELPLDVRDRPSRPGRASLPYREAVQRLASYLRGLGDDGGEGARLRGRHETGRVTVITSCAAGEGRARIAAELALAGAGAGRRIVMIDADMRYGGLSRHFGLGAREGLSDMLAEKCDWTSGHCCLEGLTLVPAGLHQADPVSLLQAPRFAELLGALRLCFDEVILNVPPITDVEDAWAAMPHADAVLLVAKAGQFPGAIAIAQSRRLVAMGNHGGIVLDGVVPGDHQVAGSKTVALAALAKLLVRREAVGIVNRDGAR